MRSGYGDARSRAWRDVDARSILGLSALRPSFLDDLPSAQSRQSQTRRVHLVIFTASSSTPFAPLRLQIDDDFDDDVEDDDDLDAEQDDEDEDDEDEDDDDVETWQVAGIGRCR